MDYLTWSMRTSTVPEYGIDNLACICIRAGAAGCATTTGHTTCGPLSSITTWLEVPTTRDAMLDLLEEIGLPGDEVMVTDATARTLSRGGHLVLVEDRDNHDSGTLYFFTERADAQALYEQQAAEYAAHLDSDQCCIGAELNQAVAERDAARSKEDQ